MSAGGEDSSDLSDEDQDVPLAVTVSSEPSPAAAAEASPQSAESLRAESVSLKISEDSKTVGTAVSQDKELPADVVEPVTRYITFKVRKLPKIDLIAKTNPVLAVWDSLSRAVVGTTEWVKGHCNADFQEVVAVKHYPGVSQELHINVFNTSSKQIRPKDFLGKAVVQMDVLAASSGSEVRMALTNEKDPKMDAWLKKRKSCVFIHIKDASLTAAVIKSGYVMTREVSTAETPVRRASVFTKDRGNSSSAWRKRFLVATHGQLAHYDCVKDFFVEEAPRVRIDMIGEVGLEDTVALGKSLIDHRRDAWQVVLPALGRAHEFDLVREELAAESLKPPGERKVRSSSDVSFAFGTGNDGMQEADKNEWLRATAIAMPHKVFGVPLAMAASRSDEAKLVPAPIRVATTWMNAHALSEEGGAVTIPEQYSGGNLASVIVQFLRRLPESIVTDRLAPVFEQVCRELVEDESKKLLLKKLLSKLPPQNFCTLKMLTAHFVAVTHHSEDNQMTIEKLAMCAFAQSEKILQMLCRYHEFVFDQATPTSPRAG